MSTQTRGCINILIISEQTVLITEVYTTMFNPTAPSSGYAQITALYVDKENMLLNTSLIVLSNAQTQINTQDRNWQSFQSGWDFACQVEMLVIYTNVCDTKMSGGF